MKNGSDKEVVERIRKDCARIEGLLSAHSEKCQCYGNNYIVGETGEYLYGVVKDLLQFAHQTRVRANDEERRRRAVEEDAEKRLSMATEPLRQQIKEAQEEVELLKRLLRVERPDIKC